MIRLAAVAALAVTSRRLRTPVRQPTTSRRTGSPYTRTGCARCSYAGRRPARALAWNARPDDEVLRALYRGVLAYHAGEYAESARVLDIAADIADERVTKSLSRAALSSSPTTSSCPTSPAGPSGS
jgi:hypothetical protein